MQALPHRCALIRHLVPLFLYLTSAQGVYDLSVYAHSEHHLTAAAAAAAARQCMSVHACQSSQYTRRPGSVRPRVKYFLVHLQECLLDCDVTSLTETGIATCMIYMFASK